jgi:hypothetical protein
MIQVQLRPETEAQLAAEAAAHGIGLAEYVGTVLERAISAPAGTDRPPKTKEEITAWLDSLAQFSDKIPSMPGATFSREWIYQDHD